MATWNGGSDDIIGHYHDMRMSFPEAHEIPVVAEHGTKWVYTVNERDKLFMQGIFTLQLDIHGERAAIILCRNYLENQTKVRPALYSMGRATNDMSYILLMGRIGLLRHHIPVSPMTYFTDKYERHMAAFRETEGEHSVWVIDPILKIGATPVDLWSTIIRDKDRCWVDFSKIPGIGNP